MLGPIHLCKLKGHAVCSQCSDRSLGVCRICSSNIMTTRNFVLEALRSKVLFKCKYKCEGCCETFPFDILRQHEQNCRYKF